MSDFDPFDLEGQEAKAEAQRAQVEQALRFEVNDLQWLMGNKRGRRIVWRLLEQAGVYRPSFHPDSATVTAFNEGQRSYGLRLLTLVSAHCREGYVAMLQERTNG